MGPDGHTASLFPNHPALHIHEQFVTFVKNSPKPPPERVTLTLNTINEAKYKIAVITGEAKSSIIKEILKDNNKIYPLAQIDHLVYYLDQSAAKQL